MSAEPVMARVDFAVRYAAQGLAVFPLHHPEGSGCSCGHADCRNIGKHPRTPNGLQDATTDTETVRGWWQRWPMANVGCVPGRSGHLVIDIDGPDGEITAGRLGLLSEPTLEVSSGREDGGRHRWYTHPGGVIGNAQLGRGIDVRADRGYVILPPSVHATGRKYRWLGRFDEIVTLPPVIAAELHTPTTTTLRTPTATIAMEPIRSGERNTSLARYAGRMFWLGTTPEETLAIVRGVNQANCSPPLTDAEVVAIVTSIGKREAAKPTRTTPTGITLGVASAVSVEAVTLEQVASQQTAEARELLSRDTSRAPRWCWHDLDRIAGPMMPGEFHVVGALMGNGKSSFLMTQMDAFAKATTGVLYIPLEIDPKLCRLRWAAWQSGLDPIKVLRGQWSELPTDARAVIDEALDDIERQPHVHFVPEKRITLASIRSWCERASGEAGVEVVMIDHLHRLSIGAHANELRVHLTETVRSIADMLRDLNLVGIAAAQLNRSGDVLDAFYPPGLDRLKESAAIAEEAWTVQMLSRRLSLNTTPGDLQAAKQGRVELATLVDPGVMVVTQRKHRLGGDIGRSAVLHVEGERVMNQPSYRTHTWEPS